ncbi:MAG: hypothetical protein ACI8QC_003823 [Planctomycetota bacterium]|jgi:uncharacterized protein (TIGR00299 family) protein
MGAMSTLLIEPLGGLAGDMLLAALLDLEHERFALADLRGLAEELVPGEAQLEFSQVVRGGVQAGHLSVHTPESHHAPHRHYSDLEKLVERAACLGEGARKRTLAALWRLAEAEGRVHGCAPESVHFHEVGAVDTLIDVCGAAMAIERLGITRIVASAPLLGSGTVKCAHGIMPVPAPATEQLMRGLPAREGGEGERLTPTGATILASWVDEFEPMGAFRTAATGYGAGTRDPKQGPPNFARVRLGEGLAGSSDQAAGLTWRLDVNLDDMTAEEIGHAVQQLRAAGALEVWSAPLLMKKDRPGTLISLLARGADRERMERLLFEWTTTLGVRWSQVQRTECGRRELKLELDGLTVRVKLRERPDYADRSPFGARDVSPEHDDVAALAEARGWTLRETREHCVRAALAQLDAQ